MFNAPYSNTRSVVELAVGLTISLMRDVTDKSAAMHAGEWNKSATGSRELRGKTLGIVGYGAIGSQLSVLAEGLGMRVIFHDLAERLALGNARRMALAGRPAGRERRVSLHVDGRAENTNLIGAARAAADEARRRPDQPVTRPRRGYRGPGPGARLGPAVAARPSTSSPRSRRTNADPFDSPLRGLPNVILTPHIGGSTEEAQEAIGEFAAERLLAYLNRGDTTFCVNLPNVQLAEVSGAHRILHIHRNSPACWRRSTAAGRAGLNILAQHLKTDERTGYVIIDVDNAYPREVIAALRGVAGTLKFRVLY